MNGTLHIMRYAHAHDVKCTVHFSGYIHPSTEKIVTVITYH